MSKCRECPVAAGTACYGETFPIRCHRADFRAVYLRWSTEPAIEGPDPDADRHLADLRRFARMGGCPWKEPCGCVGAQCLRYGGDATPTRCVACLTGARQLEGPTNTP